MNRLTYLLALLFFLYACDSSRQVAPNSGKAGQRNDSLTESDSPSGSGWNDIDGSIVNYEYHNFGGFRLHFRDNKLKWYGYVGTFKGVTAEVTPQVSKVADDIYFMSWPVPGDAYDNVVMNLRDMKVYAHLGADASFDLPNGVIHCRNTTECVVPEGEPMAPLQVMKTLVANAIEKGFSNPMDAMKAMRNDAAEIADSEKQGMAALTGKTFVMDTPEGAVKIEINGTETLSTVGNGEAESSPTYATLVAEGIYFVSWHGKPSGNHIVFNSHTMRAFDQKLADGTHAEAIYQVSCFSDQGC